MIYQLTWKTLPGMKGLYCEGFSAAATDSPETERGVAVELVSEAERDAFLQQIEEHFAAQRFSNNAAAFEAVKAYVLNRASKKA